jgi:CheY-like chemotaxis protein
MDIRMPGRDGVSVLREVGRPPPQVILMTAYASPEKLREARDAHAFAVVKKPFDVGELLGLVAGAAEAA